MKLLLAHVRLILTDLIRTPAYLIPAVVFPAMFYSLFGLSYGRHDADTANFVMTSYVAFAIVGVTLFQFGVAIAVERGRPWERYLRSLPVPVETRFLARVLAATMFATFSAALVVAVGVLLSPVSLSPLQWLELVAFALVGAVPFVMIGLSVAYVAPARGALPITNILYMLGAFGGGFWLPPNMLPSFVAAISPFLPTRQYGELLWGVSQPGHDAAHALLTLGIYGLVFSAIAMFAYRRDEKVRYA